MAYSKPTFGQILLSLSYRYGENAVPSAGIDNRKYWVNRGIEFCAEQLDLKKSVAVTVASGVADLSVSSAGVAPDFKSIIELRDSGGNKYTIVSQEEYQAMSGACCSITGNHADGFTLNVKNDGDYTLWYRFYTDPLVNDADECIIPDPEAVAAYAYSSLRKSETDPLEDAEKNMDECLERIADMADNINRNEGDLSFRVLY